MALTVLNVAYPFAPVHAAVAGGAEQILLQLDRVLTAEGHRSIVVACPGSSVNGELIESAAIPDVIDDAARRSAWEAHVRRIVQTLESTAVDVVHMHGIDFSRYLPPPGPPVLVTLHLPLGWYPQEALSLSRPGTWLHCVSRAQQNHRASGLRFLPPIENGVEIPPAAAVGQRSSALFLGRICPEKGVDVAISAAALASVPLVIAGSVFPYPDHVRFFREKVAPRLNGQCRFAGAVGGSAKTELLQQALCVLIPSLVEETSSLVAREALAAGTPVIAFQRGALVGIVENGRTGFLVQTAEEMADAITRCASIDRSACQEFARRHFPLQQMTSRYLQLYARMAAGRISSADLQ